MFKTLFHNFTRNFDFLLFSLLVAITTIGIVEVYSATYSYEDNLKFVIIQVIALVIGICLMFLVMSIDYEIYMSLWKYIFGFNILLLVAVLLFGTGLEEAGGKSWFRFGPIGFQPAELVKIGFAITLARHIDKLKDDINSFSNVCKLGLHLAVILFLIALQPDMGTGLVFCFMFIIMLYIAGLSYKYYAIGAGVFAVMLPITWYFLQPYQKNRILVFFNPESDPLGSGYHVMQSKLAIGSGEMLGKGYLNGPQTQIGILPAKHTDFIYAVIGEEFGLIGCIIVALLLFAIIIRCVFIAKNAKTDFGTLVCIGIAAMFLFHTFENIGMCIGLMPVTGIPLPFVSYGGTSILTNFIAMGLVMNVRYRCRVINF